MAAVVEVAAAVIERPDGSFLLAQRPAGKVYAGYWEFPGGKIEAGEAPAAALARELHEELGIEARPEAQIMTLTHDYPDRIVDLVLWRASLVSGEPRGLDGQQLKWVECAALGAERLLPADRPFIDALQLVSSAAHF